MALKTYRINTRMNPAFIQVDDTSSPEVPAYASIAALPDPVANDLTFAVANAEQTLMFAMFGVWVVLATIP